LVREQDEVHKLGEGGGGGWEGEERGARTGDRGMGGVVR